MSVLLDDATRDVILTKTRGYVLINTCYVWDRCCYESMVFSCDKDGNVFSWIEMDCKLYDTKEEADIGHAELINKWMKR